jgi:hypothetical protein
MPISQRILLTMLGSPRSRDFFLGTASPEALNLSLESLITWVKLRWIPAVLWRTPSLSTETAVSPRTGDRWPEYCRWRLADLEAVLRAEAGERSAASLS